VIYPGADDNASGVAVMLEAARTFTGREALVLRTKPLPRALCLVAFDLEEYQPAAQQGLLGSRRFVAEPPVPLEKCALFLTMDQMGRSLADLEPGLLFLMGSEHAEWLAKDLRERPVADGIRKLILGIDFQPPTGYSDYVAFQEKKIPFLFISTGACGHYHQPGDTPDLLDYPRMSQHVTFVRDLVGTALAQEAQPVWRDPPEPMLDEIVAVRGLVGLAVAKLETMEVPPMMKTMVGNFQTFLDKIIAKGTVTPEERKAVRGTATMLFQQAVRLVVPR
jgi:Zn-dependent M28 family amino/carboxypeptidase